MRKASSNTELFIGLCTFCRMFDIDYHRFRRRLIKCRTRIFRFNGLSYVELNDIKSILETYGQKYREAIDYLKQLG